jgi:hypothetical protein
MRRNIPRTLSTTPVEFTNNPISVGDTPDSKNLIIRINAPPSRQPLVKGERLVRIEVSAAMGTIPLFDYSQSGPNITGMTQEAKGFETQVPVTQAPSFAMITNTYGTPKGRLRYSGEGAKPQQHRC